MMFRSPREVGFIPKPKVYKKYDKIDTNELFGCDICTDGGWASETEVEIHKTKVHYKREFMNELRNRDDYCYICITKCQNKESIVKHIKTEHLLSTETCLRVEREIFICDLCSAIFFNKQNLDVHLSYAHLPITHRGIIKCVLCKKKISARDLPAHFYFHNLQSVSTCRICLCKNRNTKELAEHLKTHPYYLKCDMCVYETSRVESFQNHILLRHRNSVKVNSLTTDDKKVMTVDNDTDTSLDSDKNLISGELKGDSLIMTDDDDGDYDLIDRDLITVIEISDLDTVTDNTSTIKNLMKDTKRNKKKLKGVKKKGKKKIITPESVITAAVKNLIKDFAVKETNLAENTEKDIGKDLIPIRNYDSLVPVEDLLTDKVTDNLNEETNLMTLFDINGGEMGNFAVKSNNLTTEYGVIKNELTNSDLMIDEVMSDSNLMTVIEISDQDVTETNIAAVPHLTENVKTDKDFAINDGFKTEVNVATDLNLTDVNAVRDLVSIDVTVPKMNMENDTNLTGNVKTIEDLVTNDITVTEVKKEIDTNLTDNVKPIKDLVSKYDVIITKANTDNVVSKPVKDSEDFKRLFIPDSPSFMRLQRIAGVRGIKLSNDVHICILCREICVGFEEMRSHVDEHTVKVEKRNSYECSCGEKFTNKVLFKHHGFKSKHVMSKLTYLVNYQLS